MSCERFAGAIVDHALGAEIAPDALGHLNTCERCRARYDAQRRAIEALDADLQGALAIAPSPQFERAVRARIAERSTTTASRAIWWTALAAAAAAVVVFGLSALRSSERRADAPVTPVATQSAPAPSGSSEPKRLPHAERETAREVASATPSRRQSHAQQIPQRASSALPKVEVIVAPEQADAISRYLALVRSGKLDTSTLATEMRADGEPRELVVAPLEVEPLTVSDVEIRNSPIVDRRGPQ